MPFFKFVVHFRTKPNGFKISDVKECHQDIVGRSWSYGNEIGQFCCTRNYVSPLGQFPTVCIETEEGHPVALEMQHEYGAIGLLYVEPEYRKMKLGSIATRTLSEKVKNEGNLIFACVDENNKPSILFHEKNGFKRLPFRVCFMGYFFKSAFYFYIVNVSEYTTIWILMIKLYILH